MCCGNNGWGGNSCLWIILLIIILCCCCGNSWGGSGCGLSAGGRINVDDIPSHGREQSLSLTVPPLGAVLLRRTNTKKRRNDEAGGTQR